MSANPLKIVTEGNSYRVSFTAAEWAAMAREKGLTEHAERWEKKALERGEQLIPRGITIRVAEDKTKVRVPVRAV